MTVFRFIMLALKGAAVGAANVIPGVSGGTIALITGIYEEFVATIKSIGWKSARLLIKGEFSKAFNNSNGPFACAVGTGLLASVFTLAKVLEQLLQQHELFTMAFFFGLILASLFSVGRRVQRWHAWHTVLLVIGTSLAIGIVLLKHAEPNHSPWYIFLCGMVAMSAMILPGISGSFILLLMGNYLLVMTAISKFQFAVLVPFAAGCASGLVICSRALYFILEKWRHATLSLLTGFIAGSLLIIWPWKTKKYLLGDNGEFALRKGEKILTDFKWYLPEWNEELALAALIMLAGVGLVPLLEFFTDSKPDKSNSE